MTDLSIDDLEVDPEADLGPELARLVARHPLEILQAPGASGADEIAAALSDNRRLNKVHLRDSDLTDAGLRRLPLEQLLSLNIAGTQVTANGLAELSRLRSMSMVVLDGRQVTAETVAVLEQSPNPYRLWLYGPDVTDDTLEVLKTALGSDGPHKVMRVYVWGGTSVTETAMLAWQQDVPSVEIMYSRDAEPGRGMRSRGYTPRFWTRWFGR